LDEFFEQCFGMYAAVRRQGLDRASKRDVTYCTAWLRENGWRRVEKRLPDEQRVRVWRTPNWGKDPHLGTPKVSEVGCATVEKASQRPTADSGVAANAASVTANLEGVAGRRRSKAHPRTSPSRPLNRPKDIPKQSLNSADSRQTQNILPWQ